MRGEAEDHDEDLVFALSQGGSHWNVLFCFFRAAHRRRGEAGQGGQ